MAGNGGEDASAEERENVETGLNGVKKSGAEMREK